MLIFSPPPPRGLFLFVYSSSGLAGLVERSLSLPRTPLQSAAYSGISQGSQSPWEDNGFIRALFFPWSLLGCLPLMLSHPAVRLHELLVGCATVYNNVLGHRLPHRLIQLNAGLFEGVTFDVSV